ncbi:TonB-dependent receptor plug domain-containing protein [Novosphingobium beihaiensis]|uniref:TonB-dependent receptor n=1 Tax=Novosphingobium beihaiensis TaxID=2930389 RepID=A0ABT0BT50_9SPHN|nr:TonB-dependent receptor [Novosphingobium beihaiensis]MCJ2188153.1 TonB-dependent receptor [Novosphingobium beihaiensis]
MKTTLRKVALQSATGLAALAISATSAQAQEAENTPDDNAADQVIIVTGSRLQRLSVDTREPSIIVGSDSIEERGITNVGDALDQIPAFGPPASNPVGGQSGGFGSGQTFVDFFGLGSQRTLTLVNGQRYVSSNTASIFGPTDPGSQVDLNTIPTLMIDRIETIAVGGAPIYGSDAIAGTVNIILKDHYDGIQLGGQTGISSRSDAAQYRLSALAGTSFADGRGQVVVAFDYNKSEGLLYTDRKRTAAGLFYTSPSDPDNFPYSQELISDRRIPILSEYGAPTSADIVPGFGADFYDAAGNSLIFDANGNLVPLDFGERHTTVNSSGGNGFSLTPLSNLLSPLERYNAYGRASYELTDSIKAFAEVSYAHSKGKELRRQPVYNTWLFGDAGDPDGNLIIPLSNPFLSDDARATIASQLPDGQDFFYLGRANTDLVTGLSSSTVEVYRIVGGLEGDFNIGDRAFKWEVIGNYGHSRSSGASRQLVQQNFENALAGCLDGYVNSPIETISSTCAPFNPFGHQNGPEVGDYITTIARPVATNEQWVVTADVTGDLFELPGGPVQFALGYEHREEKAKFDPGAFYYGAEDPNDPTAPRTQYGRSIPIDRVNGKFDTNEVFGELRIPVVSPDMNVPLVHMLEVSGAARWVDHSLAGSDLTWSAGGVWKPVADFGIRGNFTRSIRSPAITELYNPTSRIFTTADDPCDARFIDQGPNPSNRAANCAAAGLPANFTSNIVEFTTEGSLSGNTGLKNEKADSWTIGAIFTPRFAHGLSLSIDWVNIKLKDAILSVDAEQTLEACYDATSFPSSACSQIDRDADGQVSFIRTGYLNAASFNYAGLIGSLNWSFNTPFLGSSSTMLLRSSYQYIDKLEQRVGTGDISTLRNSIGYSKHQATASLSYKNKAFGAFVQLQYIGKTKVDADAGPTVYEYPTRDAVTFVNSSISYDINEKFQLRFIVDNVFDTKAPYPAPAGGGVVTYFDGILGRYFKVAATTKF